MESESDGEIGFSVFTLHSCHSSLSSAVHYVTLHSRPIDEGRKGVRDGEEQSGNRRIVETQ